ncbi:hypothetical protein COV81_02055 [Candidatus Peregrinibacteria bacterium CG11_big_fil_rev_8_21_14_0_20_41_10]|nr:MAG: hypothetical protein COV81_02055 [Candidatus Peregrinibacteria bacterium CG11_big_fil_rev_8_21_14_0_20_41_10]PIZ76337.1 MAG: hypothetical protein COY06_02070 [Candidatus Peregrinibacteria bacterium CG_4_10_14_0_2_um_filter_41_8]PJC37616.1 MAG: hypothetical protein CO045_04495 [Candidatus Peregrinibacteria bacterium CG_4_9_14_0_2_um_filter_41_14]
MEVTATYNNQWHLTANDSGYNIANPGPDGTKRFYKVNSGPYGNPVITAEPDLAFQAPSTVKYIDSKGNETTPEEKIAGIICKQAGEVMHRFSLSSPKKPKYTVEQEGAELIIDGVRWHLRALFQKDKNRIINYDAWYGPDKPKAVKIVELADLDF